MNTPRTRAILFTLALFTGTAAASAQYFQGPPPPQQPYAQWEAPPPEFEAAMRRGYHDGVEGARRDFENHRRPDVNNRDEYRNPKFIAPPDRHDYRMGFRRGYEVAVHNIYGHDHDRDHDEDRRW